MTYHLIGGPFDGAQKELPSTLGDGQLIVFPINLPTSTLHRKAPPLANERIRKAYYRITDVGEMTYEYET